MIRKIIALCGVAALAFAATAQAQVTKDEAKCRATMNKGTGKYASTANKAVIGCVKNLSKGKSGPSSGDCTNPKDADAKGKLGKARDKVLSGAGKCSAFPPSYVTCPSPGQAGAVVDAAGVAACLADVVASDADGSGMINLAWREVLNADMNDPRWQEKVEGKCINSIAKNAGKMYDTYIKTVGKIVQSSDKGGGDYAPQTDRTSDAKGKVQKAKDKLAAAIAKDCAAIDQDTAVALGSCSTNVDELAPCISDIMLKNASGVNSSTFAMPGECPASVDVSGAGTFRENGTRSATSLSVGQLGLGHNAELPNGFEGAVNLACTDGTCGDCAVTAACTAGNCRCDNDPTVVCTTAFGTDAACGGGDCNLFFGPPLPLNAGGAFTCVVNRIPVELNGTADIGTGNSNTVVQNASDVYLTGTQSRPCPVCEGDTTANDGNKDGTCALGDQDGQPCDANFTDPVYGDTSYDCQPQAGQAVATLSLAIELSEADKGKTFDVPCTTGDPAGCPCNVCSNDPTVACDEDADCGAGLCNSAGPGAPTISNGCDTNNCGADGLCADGTTQGYCDGFVKQSGGGILGCDDNSDCVALTGECPEGNCGNCAISETLACFPDPIVNENGLGGQNGAVLTAQFCTPPTGTGVDLAAGTPGAADLTIEFDFVGRCANGDEFELGGNNCLIP